MKIKFKMLSELAFLPKKGTNGAAAYDVYVPKSTFVREGRQVIPLDFAIEIPYGYEAKIEPRSGFSSKGMEGKYILGTFEENPTRRFDCDVIQGKLDSDFRGNVGVIIHNRDCEFLVERGTRVAQLTFYKVEDVDFDVVEELSKTDRDTKGFGSTGK